MPPSMHRGLCEDRVEYIGTSCMPAWAAVVKSPRNQIVDPIPSVRQNLQYRKLFAYGRVSDLRHIYTIVSVLSNLLVPHGENEGEA